MEGKSLEYMENTLRKYNQEHLLKFYDEITKEGKQALLSDISRIDFEQMNNLYNNLVKNVQKKDDNIEAIKHIDKSELDENRTKHLEKIGEEVIKQNKLAIVTMAGGQGTRLGITGPKGAFELFPNESLFSILTKQLIDARDKYNITIEWYIMTSEENNDETVDFFKKKDYFGYNKDAVHFFKQGELPLVDTNGKILLKDKDKVNLASDGNGSIFVSMIKNGVLEDMKKKNIEWIFIGPVDNCLLKMIDPLFIGLTVESNVLTSAKSVAKARPEERVGVFCKRNGRPGIVEYSEITEEMANLRDEKGELVYGESNIMYHLFKRDFIERVGSEKLNYHVAFKKANYINEEGTKVVADEPNAYKFEAFIFDILEKVQDMLIMRVKREEEFAPIKNQSGVDSPETARELYLKNKNK